VPSEKLEEQKQNLAALRLHLGKLNRSIASMQRQIDEVPARAELAQYQKRFLELYTQGKLFKPPLISLYNFLTSCRQAQRNQTVLHFVQHAARYSFLSQKGAGTSQLHPRKLRSVSLKSNLSGKVK
jgi:hypothetical protein